MKKTYLNPTCKVYNFETPMVIATSGGTGFTDGGGDTGSAGGNTTGSAGSGQALDAASYRNNLWD